MASARFRTGDKVMVAGGRVEVYAVVTATGDDGEVTATQRGGTALIAEARQVRQATPEEVVAHEGRV